MAIPTSYTYSKDIISISDFNSYLDTDDYLDGSGKTLNSLTKLNINEIKLNFSDVLTGTQLSDLDILINTYTNPTIVNPTPVKGDILVDNGKTLVREIIGTDNYILTADSSQLTGLKWDSLLNNNETFGGFFKSAEHLTESSTTSNVYQQKLRLTTDSVSSGDYIILYSYQYNLTNISKPIDVRIELDDTTTLYNFVGTSSTRENIQDSGFFITTLSSGIHNIDFDYKSSQTGKSVTINDLHICIWKVSN